VLFLSHILHPQSGSFSVGFRTEIVCALLVSFMFYQSVFGLTVVALSREPGISSLCIALQNFVFVSQFKNINRNRFINFGDEGETDGRTDRQTDRHIWPLVTHLLYAFRVENTEK